MMSKKTIVIARNSQQFLEKGGDYSFLNPYSMLQILNRPDLINDIKFGFDGSILCQMVRLILRRRVERVSFDNTSLAPLVFKKVESEGLVLTIIGGSSKENELFVEKIRKKYQKIKFGYCSSGYFNESDLLDIYRRVRKSDVVICSMGSVLQEDFIKSLRSTGFNGTSYTCGGFVRQYSMSSRELYYPELINKYNIRFVYRMIKEPHTIKRYFFSYPFAVIKIFILILRRDLILRIL